MKSYSLLTHSFLFAKWRVFSYTEMTFILPFTSKSQLALNSKLHFTASLGLEMFSTGHLSFNTASTAWSQWSQHFVMCTCSIQASGCDLESQAPGRGEWLLHCLCLDDTSSSPNQPWDAYLPFETQVTSTRSTSSSPRAQLVTSFLIYTALYSHSNRPYRDI